MMMDHNGVSIPEGFFAARALQATICNGWPRQLKEAMRLLDALLKLYETERKDPREPLQLTYDELRQLTGGSRNAVKHWRAELVSSGILEYKDQDDVRKPGIFAIRLDVLFSTSFHSSPQSEEEHCPKRVVSQEEHCPKRVVYTVQKG